MLRINGLKVNIATNNGHYGLSMQFASGLNIIRGTNNAGKSTVFQCILYGLGMEELLGARNEKAMQSVLKDEILDDNKEKAADVLQSSILLEITNKETVTIERYIKSESKDPKLLVIHRGTIEQMRQGTALNSEPMFVHDAGAAKDGVFGFHAFLEQFMGLSLPNVEYNDGRKAKLYLQNLFPAFIIEQKVGWSDFLATIPYYALRDKEKKAIEFVLNLDSAKTEEEKANVISEKNSVENQWKEMSFRITNLAHRAACQIHGFESKPVISDNENHIRFSILDGEESISLPSYTEKLTKQVEQLEKEEIPKIESISKQKEAELGQLDNLIETLNQDLEKNKSARYDSLTSLNAIVKRQSELDEELEQNKNHQKVMKLGADNGISTAQGKCPTCGQPLTDSLLPQEMGIEPMGIDENIEFIKSQKSMAELSLKTLRAGINQLDLMILTQTERIADARQTLRLIKRDLISDGRSPSVEAIERRIKLRSKLDFYLGVLEELKTNNLSMKELGDKHSRVLERLKKLDGQQMSAGDEQKMKTINSYFRTKLYQFGYGSKQIGGLGISSNRLIPVAMGDSNINYNMRFDSSASDLVRAIAAYTCALLYTSDKHHGNHPNFIMMDEPGNQETSQETLRSLFDELSKLSGQSIVFTSPKETTESKEAFPKFMTGIQFNLIRPEHSKFIQPIKN